MTLTTHSLLYQRTTAVVVLAFCLARRQPFRILPKPHALRLDASVALQCPRQHISHQSRLPPALPPLHKSIHPLKAITSSLRAKFSAVRVVTTFTRFISWTAIFTSFAFALTVAIFGTGVGLDRNSQNLNLQPTSNCQSAIYASVTLYVLTKVCTRGHSYARPIESNHYTGCQRLLTYSPIDTFHRYLCICS